MTTKFNKSELIEKLQNLKGQISVYETQVGFCPNGSSLYYWFKISYNGTMKGDYTWNQKTGEKSYTSFNRFFNFIFKNNLI
jgi:hypothetical protein